MDKSIRLLLDRLRQLRMAVTEDQRHHAGTHVEVVVAVHVGENDAFSLGEDHSRLVAPSQNGCSIPPHKVSMLI